MTIASLTVSPSSPVSQLPRRVIDGVSVLLSPTGPQVEVAERVRAVHTTGRTLSIERGEVLQVQGCWIYRVFLQLAGQGYVGDAEIPLRPPTRASATAPISCAQTAAVGQALAFAGFGDLKSVLARLGRLEDLAAFGEEELEALGLFSRQAIAGVQTVWIDQLPYVTEAERLFHLHQSGTRLHMERCTIVELAGTWVYRVTTRIGEQRYVGDAEIFFDAAPGTPDVTHPISCAQRLAVGNALALAGFGDVRSILARLGKDSHEIDAPPLLASADAVIRARQQAQPGQQGQPTSRASPEQRGQAGATPSGVAQRVDEGRRMTEDQRQHIAALCQRLGIAEPVYAELDVVAADQFIAHLQTEQEDLLQSVEEVHRAPGAPVSPIAPAPLAPEPAPNPLEAPPASNKDVVAPALVRQLKQLWREVFRPAGETAAQFAAWETFKTRLCGGVVPDQAMRQAQYDRLRAACLPASIVPASPASVPNRSSSRAPVREAPRLTTAHDVSH